MKDYQDPKIETEKTTIDGVKYLITKITCGECCYLFSFATKASPLITAVAGRCPRCGTLPLCKSQMDHERQLTEFVMDWMNT